MKGNGLPDRNTMTTTGTVRLTKVVLNRTELGKLDATDRKRFLMLASIIQDMAILQRFLLFTSPRRPSAHPVVTSAEAIQIVFLISILGSKLHEAGQFLQKEGLLLKPPLPAAQCRDEVTRYYDDPMVAGILSFIRNKFGFHYDTYDDLDPKIDAAFAGLDHAVAYLSEDDSGNELFSSANDVITQVVYSELTRMGFDGDRQQFLLYLFDICIQGACVVAQFSRPTWRMGFQ